MKRSVSPWSWRADTRGWRVPFFALARPRGYAAPMLYRILVPSLKPDDVSMTIDVEADNWMLALRVGLEEIGADRDLVKRAIREINEDNSIHVIEPKENRVFVLREITAAEADRPIVTPKARQAPPERAATPVLVGAAVGSATEPVFATPEPATAARKVTTEIPVWAMDVGGSAFLRVEGPAEDRVISIDATLVQHAVLNRLTNAEKHGGGATGVSVRSRPGWVVVEVEDSGGGFAPGEEQRVFLPFTFREPSAPSADASGVSLGLGLALVKRIADAHGGQVYARNRPAGGATVGLELPR